MGQPCEFQVDDAAVLAAASELKEGTPADKSGSAGKHEERAAEDAGRNLTDKEVGIDAKHP